MARVLHVYDSYGQHKFPISRETPEFIETDKVSPYFENPLRYNKREERMEQYTGEIWDVFISDSSIFQVEIVDEPDDGQRQE